MKRFFTSLAVILLLVPSLSLAATSEADLKAAIDAKAKLLEDVTKQIQQTQDSLNQTTVLGNSLKQEISKMDTSIKTVNLGIQKTELLIDQFGLQIESLGDNIKTNEQLIDDKRAAIQSIITNVQVGDTQTFLLTVLSGKSLADTMADAQSLAEFNAQLLKQVNEIRDLKEDLLTQRNDVAAKKTAVEQQSRTLQAQKNIAEDQRQERAQLLAQTKNQEKLYQQSLTVLEKQQQSISAEIDDIEAQLRATYNPSAAPGKRAGALGYPIDNNGLPIDFSRCGKAGSICTQGYGATAFAVRAYKTQFHNGVDFGSPIGTPVLAASDGTITIVGNNGRLQYGKYILIKHDNNISTLYGHLSRQIVTSGMTVKRGQVIGYVGNTGYATGPHLHLTVYLTASVSLKNIPGAGIVPVGYTLNPLDYL